MKHSRQCVTTFPNTSKLAETSRCAWYSQFSSFGNVVKLGISNFEILLFFLLCASLITAAADQLITYIFFTRRGLKYEVKEKILR